MKENRNLYDRYTSTSALSSGIDETAALQWTKGYFKSNYAKLLPTERSSKILEVGCGYGGNLITLSEMGFRNCYGIDISTEQIAHAKSVLGLENVERADALMWLNGKQSIFDCILALDVLEHLEIEDLLDLGEKMCLALKPGGTVIVQVPNGMSPINPYLYGDLTHVRAFTPQSMHQFFLMVKLIPVEYREIPPHIHGYRSAVRRAFWTGIFKPFLGFFMKVIRGRMIYKDIFTPVFIAVAKRNIQNE